MESPQALFNRYLTPGAELKQGEFKAVILTVDRDELIAYAKVLSTTKSWGPCWFSPGEDVILQHVRDEVWRMTSEKDDHGQAVFLGEDYGGVGIGS